MWGPGDIGPTSAGQLVNDVARGKLPGLVPGSFSVVDARDVALARLPRPNVAAGANAIWRPGATWKWEN